MKCSASDWIVETSKYTTNGKGELHILNTKWKEKKKEKGNQW